MKEARLLVLLCSIWSGSFGLNDTTQTWTTSEDGDSQKTVTSALDPLNKIQSLPVLPTTEIMAAELGTEIGTSKESLLPSVLFPSETRTPADGVRNPVPHSTEKTERVLKLQTLALPTQFSIKFNPGAESVVLSNSTLKFLQSFSRKSNKVIPLNSVGSSGNRSPRETDLNRGDTSGNQRTSFQKSSFETTRGKNWCAYVHTRLSPTVILDNQVTYVPRAKGPCGWNSGFCPQRSQRISNPVYRMQHKIVTSLEWKCCPGFSGAKCQLKAQEQQQLIHTSQAESHAAVVGGTAEQQRQQQQQDCGDPAVTQKMSDQMNHQAMKLALLQKRIDNISLAVTGVRSTCSSLEEKIKEDKGREFQSFLKDLKSNSINDLIKDIVGQQLKIFQNDMQETVAQLFKSVSRLSKELEDTRHIIQQVNESVVSIAVQQKSVLIEENRPTLADIIDLKNQIVNVRQEMSFTCEKPIKELEAKQTQLEGALKQEHSRNILYYESLHKTLSKMKEVHEESTEQISSQQSIPAAESVSNNVTEYLSTLHENIKKQGLMMLQMFDNLHIQDKKINNLTITLEMEKEFFRDECEDKLSKYRNDFEFQIKDTEENLQVLNQTLTEVLFPMDNKIDKMNEQLNDLTYDMEILQPFLEQAASFRETMTQEQPKEAIATRKKVENLTSTVNSLNFHIRELAKRYNLLRNEVQSRSDVLDRRINEYALELEDGLNKTMTIINNAIDFIQDNYMLKETFSTLSNLKVNDKCTPNLDTILAFIPQFQRLNDSIQLLVNDSQRYNFVLQVAKALAAVPKEEKLSQFNLQNISQMVNEMTSQVKQYQENMSHLEEKMLSATKISQNFESWLQDTKSNVTKTLMPYYVSIKEGVEATTEKDQALQLQVLNSRFKALETKVIRLSINFSLLNKTLYKALTMCHNASTSISELNATIPKWINGSPPDVRLLQQGLTEFVESVIEIKTQIALSNLTSYINQSLSNSLANIFKSQKQVKSLLKKPSALKKPTVNVTNVLIGRTQRNTDNVLAPVTEELCSMSPCRNGGTCINGRTSFICACRHPFIGRNCTVRLVEENALAPDFSKGSYRYAPMVAFFTSHTYGMTTPGPILFNNLEVNYGSSYTPSTGKFRIPYLGVYVFKYTIESFSAHVSGFLVVDGRDKLAFESANSNSGTHCERVLTGDALLELNYGQEVWLRLVKGTIPAKFPPATTFSGYLLYRT